MWRGGSDLPDGVVHARHGQVGCQVGRVGGTNNEGKKPPAAHDDAQGHGAHHAVPTYMVREGSFKKC